MDLVMYPQNPQAEARRPMWLYLGVVLKEEVTLNEVTGVGPFQCDWCPCERRSGHSHTQKGDM